MKSTINSWDGSNIFSVCFQFIQRWKSADIGGCCVSREHNWRLRVLTGLFSFEPLNDKNNKMTCAPSEDSDQSGHPPSLIRFVTVLMKKHYLFSAQWRLWSDWADAKADLSLRWVHRWFCWFCRATAHFIIMLFLHVDLNIVGHNTKCCICIFPTFPEKQNTEFLLLEWFICFKILNRHTEYDKKWYTSMHSLFHALCNPPIWWNFSAVPAFCPNIYCFSTQIWHFVFYSFLSCWWSVMTGVLTNYSPSISFQTKCIWFSMTGYTCRRCFCCRYSILDHVSDTTFCLYFQLWPLFSLVSDKLVGQVSEQKDVGTLDKVKKPIKKFWRNCRYGILYRGRQYVVSWIFFFF